jgi:hypothetical protein
MHAAMSDTLDHVFRCSHVSLKGKQQKVLKEPFGRHNSMQNKPKPLQSLKKEESLRQLRSRGMYPDPELKPTKADLEK